MARLSVAGSTRNPAIHERRDVEERAKVERASPFALSTSAPLTAIGASSPYGDAYETRPSAVVSARSSEPSLSRSPKAAGPVCVGVTIESSGSELAGRSPWRTTIEVRDSPSASPSHRDRHR